MLLGMEKATNTSRSVHILGAVYMLKKDLKGPKLSLLDDLEALCKQEGKVKAEL